MVPHEFLQHPFWDIPPRTMHGDENVDEIYRAVGKSLSQWEHLEIALSDLFAILVESKSIAARRAYGSLASATARYDALDRAAEIYFEARDQNQYAIYKDILKAMRLASPRRNDIAHGTAVIYADPNAPGGGHFLAAPDYNTRRTDPFLDLAAGGSDPFTFARHRYAYTSAQINEYTDRFDRLHRIVFEFSRQLNRTAKLSLSHQWPTSQP